MQLRILILSFLLITGGRCAAAEITVVASDQRNLIIDLYFSGGSAADLHPVELLIGLPDDDYPLLVADFQNQQPVSGEIEESIDTGTTWTGKQRLRGLSVAILRISPYAGNGEYYRNLRLNITFEATGASHRHLPADDQQLLVHRIVNWEVARNWGHPPARALKKAMAQPAGTWFKFSVAGDGMLVVPAELFNDFNQQMTGKDPRSFRLFTSSSLGRDRSQQIQIYDLPVPDNLVECTIQIEGESDGSFDSGDRIIFYGRGANGFDYKNGTHTFHQSLFYRENTYWLLIPEDGSTRGRRVAAITSNPATPIVASTAQIYQHYEYDITNPDNAGPLWVGPQISQGTNYSVPFAITAPVSGSTSRVWINMKGSGETSHQIKIYHQNLQNPLLRTLLWSGSSQYGTNFTTSAIDWAGGGNIVLSNQSGSSASRPYLDYLTVRTERQLTFNGSSYEFFLEPAASGIRADFTSTTQPLVWDICDPAAPRELITVQSSTGFSTLIPDFGDTTGRFVVFSSENLPAVSDVELVADAEFDRLRHSGPGVNHIIIAPLAYADAMQPLATHRGNSLFVPLEQVYREFTAGNPDPLAIRLFIQWALENWSGSKPTCLFLVGDADHDYRNISGRSKIIVPTIILAGGYEGHYATDDQLVTIYGDNSQSLPEVAIGRLPARSVQDAEIFVDKLIAYETDPEPGLWRQRLTLVADDAARPEPNHGSIATGKSHTEYSEGLVPLIAPAVTVQKLYMMEFPEVSDASSYGVIKPAATQALIDYVNRGTAFISYIGHGSPHLWAQERLFDQNRGDITALNTNGQLPIWIAATCSWGHFDDIAAEAFSEDLIRSAGNAAAIITTSRAISVSSNKYYIEKIFQRLFPGRDVTREPIGVVLQSVKTGSIEGQYFHLFGDPAMPLPIPAETVSVTGITPDTIRTLETASFSGRQDLSRTGGVGYITVTDADRSVTRDYVIQSQPEQLSYTLPGATLFRGQFDVTDTVFQGLIRIPKDISYSDQAGKLTIYFQSDDEFPQEALGYLDDIHFAGGMASADQEGPMITFETTDRRQLRSGDHLRLDQGLLIRLTDPLGINISNEVGHGIQVVDRRVELTHDLTNDFLYDPNKITTGTIDYSRYLTGENIDLHISAWDNANNPAEAVIQLSVSEKQGLRLYHVLNYPNPFSASTRFTFELSTAADVKILVYTLAGRKIRTLPAESFAEGYHFIAWDGRDEYGNTIANGVYLYSMEARNSDGKITTIGKLAKYQ
ncbi:MAG: type IX secretion system sortase PorU [Candidatus Neomarinimicrobiota bacterium]